jgi:hypothetical protein
MVPPSGKKLKYRHNDREKHGTTSAHTINKSYFFNCKTRAFLDLVITGFELTILGLFAANWGPGSSSKRQTLDFRFRIGVVPEVLGLKDITVDGDDVTLLTEAAVMTTEADLFTFASFDLMKCGFFNICIKFLLLTGELFFTGADGRFLAGGVGGGASFSVSLFEAEADLVRPLVISEAAAAATGLSNLRALSSRLSLGESFSAVGTFFTFRLSRFLSSELLISLHWMSLFEVGNAVKSPKASLKVVVSDRLKTREELVKRLN